MSDMPPPHQQGPEPARNPRAEGKAAKAYAKATRPWYMKKRWWLVAVVFVVIAASVAAGGGSNEESEPTTASEPTASSKPAEGQPAEEPAAKPVRVRAAAIVKEFEENELAADNKYKGKTLRIAGVVNEIDTDIMDQEKYILRLGGGGDFEFLTVNCNDMSTDELSTLNKGDSVTVVGKFADGGDLGVEVSDCTLA